MDNEFKRRLIRHLENACRDYHRRLDPTTHPNQETRGWEPLSIAELTEAIDDCMKMIAMLKRDDRH